MQVTVNPVARTNAGKVGFCKTTGKLKLCVSLFCHVTFVEVQFFTSESLADGREMYLLHF